MSAKTPKQQRYMGMCLNPRTRRRGCPPPRVARKFARKPKTGYKRK